jgi:hypothetical protein
VAASTDVFDNLSTAHQLTAPGGLAAAVYEVMPQSTANGYGDVGGRRYRVRSGPWATSVTQTALDTVQVQWSTDWPADSVLEFGPTPSLGSSVSDPALVTNHSLSIEGLPIGLQYYRVRSAEPVPAESPPVPVLTMRSPVRWFIVRSPYPGDFDGDMDVDQEDFAHLQACFTGQGNAVTDPACFDADLDGDGDVDQTDFEIFQKCFAGASVTPDPGCIN